MHEYGRCKSTPQITGRCASNTSEPQPYIARRSLLSITANSDSELNLIKSPSSGESQSWIRDHHSYHGAGYHIPLARCQPTFHFTRWSHAFAESVSLLSAQSVILWSIAANVNLIESPPKGESQPRLRSIYHSYHSASVYRDIRCTRPWVSCV